MGQYSQKFGQLSQKDGTVVADRVVAFLRARHPTKTADMVAAETNINPATVRKWMERASLPSGLAMLRLVAVYGPEFLSAVKPGLRWVETVVSASRADAARRQIAEAEQVLEEIRRLDA